MGNGSVPEQKRDGNGGVKISRKVAEDRLASAGDRRKRSQRASRRFRQLLLLVFLGFVVVAAIGVKRRAPWYTATVVPAMERVWNWLDGNGRSAPSGTVGGAVAEPVARVVLPTYRELEDGEWFGDMGADGNGGLAGAPPGGVQSEPPVAAGGRPVVDTATRPRPPDLDFHKFIPEVRAHVLSQPGELRRLEADRVIHVARARDHLIMLMRFIPYESGPQGILLNRGATPPGTVVGANETGFLFHPRNGNARTLAWEDIAIVQYAAFFQFYIARRIQFDGPPSWQVLMEAGQRTPLRNRKDAAGECLLVGLLCDWYGNPGLGENFLRLAVSYDPNSEARRFLK